MINGYLNRIGGLGQKYLLEMVLTEIEEKLTYT